MIHIRLLEQRKLKYYCENGWQSDRHASKQNAKITITTEKNCVKNSISNNSHVYALRQKRSNYAELLLKVVAVILAVSRHYVRITFLTFKSRISYTNRSSFRLTESCSTGTVESQLVTAEESIFLDNFLHKIYFPNRLISNYL